MLHTQELRCENGTNGSWVDRAIGMATRARIDRANIQTGTAADTVQRLTAHFISKDIGASIVEQNQVEGLRAISRCHSCPQTGVGIHPLARRTARQQLQEDSKVLECGQDFLDTHHSDEGLW